MTWYYRLDKEEKVNTLTDIPKEQWEKKQVLPYRREAVTDETKVKLAILKSEVVDRYYKAPVIKKTLEEVKKQKNRELKNTYTELTNEGFVCSNGIRLDCRESDKINWLTTKLTALSSTNGITLKDFNNMVHTLSSTVVLTMLGELESYYEELLKTKWSLQIILNSYTTIEEVEAFYWRKGIFDETTEMMPVLTGYTYWVI